MDYFFDLNFFFLNKTTGNREKWQDYVFKEVVFPTYNPKLQLIVYYESKSLTLYKLELLNVGLLDWEMRN